MAARITSIGVDQAGGATAVLIAAKTGFHVEVIGFNLSVGGAAVTVKSTIQDETGNTVRMTMVGNATTPVVYAYSGTPEAPAFTTAISDAVELTTGTAAAICGFITFRYVRP